MFTLEDFATCYDNIISEVKNYNPSCDYSSYFEKYPNMVSRSPMTEDQWDNLVKVCSVIEANYNRFKMATYHETHTCGTAHCIAGWAASIAVGDTNDNKIAYKSNDQQEVLPISVFSSRFISEYTYPFYFLTNDNLALPNDFDIEDLVMRHFIEPVLEAAKYSSQELTEEINQLIAKMQNTSCPVAV